LDDDDETLLLLLLVLHGPLLLRGEAEADKARGDRSAPSWPACALPPMPVECDFFLRMPESVSLFFCGKRETGTCVATSHVSIVGDALLLLLPEELLAFVAKVVLLFSVALLFAPLSPS
jgi:hypothetical protein